MGCFFTKPLASRSSYDMKPVIKSPVIFVSGVPGAGYSTASQTLAALTGYHVIRPGELVRSQAADTASLRGMRLAKMLQHNKVSEEIIVDLVKENMLENADAKGFILCGFPKNKKMANIYKREVKMPEKVISLQVADEVATMRLQQKLTELGRPETEVLEAKDIVRSAAPKIRKVTDRFKKDSVIMVNSSQGNIETLNETLQTATESFKEFMETEKNETTDALKKDEEDFDLINLSSSVESCTLVSSTILTSKDLIETVAVLEPHQLDIPLETVEPIVLGNTASEILDMEPVIQNNLENSLPVNIMNDDDNISLASVEVHRAPFDAFKATIKPELNNYVLAEKAQSSHGVIVSQSFNQLGKTPESTDLLNISDDGEINNLADCNDADRYDHLEDPEDCQKSSQHFKDLLLDETKYQQARNIVPKLVNYNSFNTGQTGQIGQCDTGTEQGQVKGLKSKPDERRMLSTSAETACMRDHIKLLKLSEATES